MDISIKEACKALNNNPNIILIDVRTPEEYRNGCIAGSRNIPLSEIRSYAYDESTDKNAITFVHCQSGGRSRQAKAALVVAGFKNVYDIGGIHGWKLTKPSNAK